MRIIKSFLFLFFISTPVFAGSITVDYYTVINPDISRAIFGVNLSAQSATCNDPQFVSNMARVGIGSLRYNAGFPAEHYDWYRNKTGGTDVATYFTYPNGTRTIDVIDTCRKTGALPLLTVNSYLDSAVRDSYWSNIYPYGKYTDSDGPQGWEFASDWVKYCNIDLTTAYDVNPAHPGDPFNVTYWEIGNEPVMNTRKDVSNYCNTFRRYYTNMKKIDSSIKILGPAYKNYPFNLAISNFLFFCGDIVDVIAVHRYPMAGAPNFTTLLANTGEWDTYASQFDSWISKFVVNKWGRPASSVKIAVTEWGSTYNNYGFPPSGYDMGQVLWVSDVLGKFAKNNFLMGHYYAHMNNTCGQMFSDVTPYDARAPGLGLKFMATHLNNKLVKSSSTISDLSTYCSFYSNFLSLVVINKSASSDYTVDVNLGIDVDNAATVYKLEAFGDPVIQNISSAKANMAWTFKKYSVTCIKFNPIKSGSFTISVKGGSAFLTNMFVHNGLSLTNGFAVTFPSGYADSPVVFNGTIRNSSILSNMSQISNFISSYSFSSLLDYTLQPVQFTLKYCDGMIPSGKSENQLGVYYFNGVEWEKVDAAQDAIKNQFVFKANKLNEDYFLFSLDPNKSFTGKAPAIVDKTQWSYNPFSPNGDGICDTTRIQLSVDSGTELTVQIFDSHHKLVRTIFNQSKATGINSIEWDGKDDRGRIVSPGAYIYLVRVNNSVRKGVLIVAY